jgi:hypothetical protein
MGLEKINFFGKHETDRKWVFVHVLLKLCSIGERRGSFELIE